MGRRLDTEAGNTLCPGARPVPRGLLGARRWLHGEDRGKAGGSAGPLGSRQPSCRGDLPARCPPAALGRPGRPEEPVCARAGVCTVRCDRAQPSPGAGASGQGNAGALLQEPAGLCRLLSPPSLHVERA